MKDNSICKDCVFKNYLYCKAVADQILRDDITHQIIDCDLFINEHQYQLKEFVNESKGC